MCLISLAGSQGLCAVGNDPTAASAQLSMQRWVNAALNRAMLRGLQYNALGSPVFRTLHRWCLKRRFQGLVLQEGPARIGEYLNGEVDRPTKAIATCRLMHSTLCLSLPLAFCDMPCAGCIPVHCHLQIPVFTRLSLRPRPSR